MLPNRSHFRALHSYTNLFIALFVLLLPNYVLAGTPSYIGPYSYSGYFYNGNTPPGYSGYKTEAEAAQAGVNAALTANGNNFCNYQMGSAPSSGWETSGDDVVYVEGVEARSEHHVYYINYYQNMGTWCGGNMQAAAWAIVRSRIVCSSMQRFFDGKCVNISWLNIPGLKGKNQGPTCLKKGTQSCGQPINTATGNMWHVQSDFADRSGGRLSLTRTYNSQILEPSRSNLFGGNWTVDFDARLTSVLADNSYRSQKCYQRQDNSQIFCEANVSPYPLTTAPAIEVFRGDGKYYVFNLVAGVYQGDKDTDGQLTVQKGADGTVIGFNYTDAQSGALENYDANGRLLSIVTQSGVLHSLTYTDGTTNDTRVGRYPANSAPCRTVPEGDVQPAGRLACVTDGWGRQLTFKYDSKGRVIEFYDPAGHAFFYEYDGPTGGCIPSNASTLACSANNLTKVTYPDGGVKQYVYNEASGIYGGNNCGLPNVGNGFGPFVSIMTGLVDELNVRYISWLYNCRGQAKLSTLPGNVESVTIGYYQSDYGVASYSEVLPATGPANSITYTSAIFTPSLVLDVYKIGAISVPCAACGPIKSRTFDANGNVASTNDFGGNVTKYTYDLTRNLETSRVEASGSLNARTITTVWHSNLRLPLTIAEPKRITTYVYDDHGNVLTKSEQTTSDMTGASGTAASPVGTARTWTYTYNTAGQVTSQTGPRQDVLDKTTYDYDDQGNLALVTNPLGQATMYSGYDANGNVGHIVEPNGLITDLSYNFRGKVASRTVSDGTTQEITTFNYDLAGQLTKQINSDGSWTAFGYDPAHRLVSVSDNRGNSIVYTLDVTGNRLGEQVKDPTGALTRQVARVFDNLNQLTKVTGAAR